MQILNVLITLAVLITIYTNTVSIAASGLLMSPFGDQYLDKFRQICTYWFVDQMLELQQTCSEYFKQNLEIQTSIKEEEQFQNATKCWLCEKPLFDKARNHDHLFGKYRGAACNTCNLIYSED